MIGKLELIIKIILLIFVPGTVIFLQKKKKKKKSEVRKLAKYSCPNCNYLSVSHNNHLGSRNRARYVGSLFGL
jgi:hypothetical protein